MDKEVNQCLKKDGWKIIRIWEYDVKHNFEKVIQRIIQAIS